MRYPPITRINLARTLSARLYSTAPRVPLLITPHEYKSLPKATTLPLDVSWHMPNSTRSAVAEYLSGPRLPGAKRFDLDEVAELSIKENPLSLGHMLPTAERFAEACQELGINNDTHVVVYDTVGVFSSPRGAYTFKAFGHDKVSILDGGLPRWIAEGGETEVGEVAETGASEYTQSAGPDPGVVRSYEQIVENTTKPAESADLVLDARALPRFTGEAPEPRPGLSSGHMPNSRSLPFTELLAPASADRPYSSFKKPAELRQVLRAAAGDTWADVEKGDKEVVFTCGSGMTAAIGWAATRIVAEAEGKQPVKAAIYDESWTGYASRKESKIEKGPAK
ncbi:hypothetical protein Q5752_002311 [Cryptotrichosporon argae]